MLTQIDQSASRRVLLITASVGAGHNQATKAILELLRQRSPQLGVDVIDSIDMVPRFFRAYYAGGFAIAVSKLPRSYGVGFWISDRPQRPGRCLNERVRLWTERRMLRRLGEHLRANRYDLIVNMHFLTPPYITRLGRRGWELPPQWVVITDIEVHRFWYSEGVEHWFAPSEYSAAKLHRWGIPDGRVTVSGIPVHPKWTAPLDRSKILQEWRLPADKKIVLLAGGAEFTCGPVAKMARDIVEACPEAYVVVLGGRNKKLLADLASMPESPGRLVGVAFTDRVHELVEVCSIMVTKAGGITTTECLAKGTPMILMRPVPGQERGNAQYLASQGAAVVTRDFKSVTAELLRLLKDPEALAALAGNARRLDKPATETIVSEILRRVEMSSASSRP